MRRPAWWGVEGERGRLELGITLWIGTCKLANRDMEQGVVVELGKLGITLFAPGSFVILFTMEGRALNINRFKHTVL